jgi:hypothetical protein
MKTKTFVRSLTSAIRNALILMAGITLLMTFTSSAFAQTNWVTSSSVPPDAILGGQESDGAPLYVCHGGTAEGYGLQPGKYRPGLSGCDFGIYGFEVTVPDFQYLVSSWKSESAGSIPSNAVIGGCTNPPPPPPGQLPGPCGVPYYYYCRATIPGHSDLQPGKIASGFAGCHVSYGGQELIEPSYQVLVALNPSMPLTTVGASGGNVPFGAVRGGIDTDGQALYMCTAAYGNGQHPGKVRQQFGACYIPYGGREVAVHSYQVLVPTWSGSGTPDYDFGTGHEPNGAVLYTCRGHFEGGLHPGSKTYGGDCNFGWGGLEQSLSEGFDILTDWTYNPPK